MIENLLSHTIVLLDHWQSLAGAFIGAFIPIVVSFLIFYFKTRNDLQRELVQSERFVVFSINNLYDAREELELFLDRIDILISALEKSLSEDVYFLATTNFPVLRMEHTVQDINKSTKSLYLANKLMKCYSMLRDTYNYLEEASNEFKAITCRNYDVVLSYKDPAQKIGIGKADQKNLYLSQLKAFRGVIKDIIIDKNIPITIKSLLEACIVLRKYLGNFQTFWKIYYEGINDSVWKYDRAQEIIEKKFKKQLDKDFQRSEMEHKERMVFNRKNGQSSSFSQTY